MATKAKPRKRATASARTVEKKVKKTVKKSTTRTASGPDAKADEAQQVFDFVSMLVHDLEAPLASMKYALDLVRSDRYDSTKELHRRVLSSAEVAAQRAEDLIADILSVAHSERNGLQANMEQIELCDIAKQSISLAVAAGAERGVSVMIDRRNEPDCSATVSADSSLLSRTMDNLIYNAIRHTPEGGNVVVSVMADKKCATIAVTDTGIGMQGVNPDELFEKFGQVKHRKAAQHRGVGLGLYFCRLAADAMDAEIFAENTIDSGARFGLRFKTTNA